MVSIARAIADVAITNAMVSIARAIAMVSIARAIAMVSIARAATLTYPSRRVQRCQIFLVQDKWQEEEMHLACQAKKEQAGDVLQKVRKKQQKSEGRLPQDV